MNNLDINFFYKECSHSSVNCKKKIIMRNLVSLKGIESDLIIFISFIHIKTFLRVSRCTKRISFQEKQTKSLDICFVCMSYDGRDRAKLMGGGRVGRKTRAPVSEEYMIMD